MTALPALAPLTDGRLLPALVRAREFILKNGGLAKAQVFTRCFLAYFGQYPWDGLPTMPVELVLLPNWFPINIYEMSSWAGGTVVPLVVLMAKKPYVPIPADRGVEELWLNPPALADYAFEVYRYEKSLRMTKQEVLREHKESEGDPLVKSRIRSLQRATSRKRMLRDVSKADVVITNPTHIAVALKYNAGENSAPLVLAMGERKLAERIKALAARAGVPMVENRPLAHALLATAKVGQQIPASLYAAVAEVLAYVYRIRRGNG